MRKPKILLTGATGYVGSHLLPSLMAGGFSVRCLVRNPEKFSAGPGPKPEIFKGDVLKTGGLSQALQGIDVAYYLIHSLSSPGVFEDLEARGAENFAEAARKNGIKRIIYLGGLASQKRELSAHFRSRHRVGEILRASGIPTIEFRASVILGSGSLSFEMVRSLVEKLPIMITPKWVRVPSQPIYIGDVLEYLVRALEYPSQESCIFEIGGEEQVSYGDIMKEYARQRGLRRWMLPVPVLTPRLSSLWLHLVTPIYARVGRRLIDSIRFPSIVRDPRAREIFPFKPKNLTESIELVLKGEDSGSSPG